jgi:ATP-dependent Clp protease ATP-binding subunit ClpA
MFERFSDRARRVVVLAQDEARNLGHNYIGTEHILLGLIREGDGVGAQVLAALGVDLNRAPQQVIQLLHGRPAPVVAADLRQRLASVAARLAVIERRLGDAGAGPG